LFVLQECEKVNLEGESLAENLAEGVEGLPPSNNDG